MLLSWVKEHGGQPQGNVPLGHQHRSARSRNLEKSSEIQRRREQKEKTVINELLRQVLDAEGGAKSGSLSYLVVGQVSGVLVHSVLIG